VYAAGGASLMGHEAIPQSNYSGGGALREHSFA
jgi:hypothetical protein